MSLARVVVAKQLSTTSSAETDNEKEHKLEYYNVALIQIGETVGAGILVLPNAFACLGWVFGIALLVLFAGIAFFVGYLLTVNHQRYPAGESLSELVGLVFDSRWGFRLTWTCFLLYCMLSMSGFLQGAAQALQMTLFNVDGCFPLWSLIVVVVLTPLVQVRDYSSARFIVFINMILILFAVLGSCAYMIMHMKEYHAKQDPILVGTTLWPHEKSNWRSILGAISQIVFAYGGAFFYPEMMREMRDARDFPKSLQVSIPIQLVMYIFVASIGYIYGGQNAHDIVTKYINFEVAPGLFRSVSVCLMLHLFVSFVLFSTPVSRSIQSKISPSTMDMPTWRGRAVWAAISLTILILAYLFANLIPLFGAVIAIVGSLIGPSLNLGIPCLCYSWGSVQNDREMEVCECFENKLGESVKGFESEATERTSFFKRCFVHVSIISLLVFTIFITPVGTTGNIINFLEDMHTNNQSVFNCVLAPYKA